MSHSPSLFLGVFCPKLVGVNFRVLLLSYLSLPFSICPDFATANNLLTFSSRSFFTSDSTDRAFDVTFAKTSSSFLLAFNNNSPEHNFIVIIQVPYTVSHFCFNPIKESIPEHSLVVPPWHSLWKSTRQVSQCISQSN